MAPAADLSAATDLSATDVRRLQLRAQRLFGPRPKTVDAMLRDVGAVQLDTISVLARSHELVAYARVGATTRARIEGAYWSRPARAFEYWGHQASIMPIEWWPWFAFRRRRYRAAKTRWSRTATPKLRSEVIARVRDLGGCTIRELGGAKGGGPWWDWTPVKIAAELLLDEGVLACVERQGFRRVYDLAERAIPDELRNTDPDDIACYTTLVQLAADRLGVATVADLANYFQIKIANARAGLQHAALEPVTVDGWPPAYAAPGTLAGTPQRARHRPVLLSPFDSLIWDRKRAARVFDFEYRLEAYVPRELRVNGYFVMPFLAGDQLVGRVDPKRDGRTLVARRIQLADRRAVDALASALVSAAQWVGCDMVAVELVDPPDIADQLRTALAAVT